MRQQLRAWLALWWVAAGPAATAGAPVRITLDLAGEGREPVAARLELSPERREDQGTLESRSIPLTAPGQLEIDLPKVVWHATAQAPGFWSETRVFVPRAGPAGEAIALRLFPIGVVKAEVEVPPGERSPASLTASFAAAPGRAAAEGPQGTVSCPIGERRLHCSLPAGRFDLQLRADGFAPAYLWDVQVQAGAEKALGLVRLWRGSSVSGRVEMADGLPAPGEVELGLQTAGVPLPETARRLGLLARRVQANERGFFQFLAVPPGTYELTVARAGFAPARAAPVVVREGLETQLIEPLVLAPPAVFEVAVSPPADPYGRAWRLRLMEKVAGTVQAGGVIAGSANPEGRWERSGLPPGSYRLSIEDQDGSRWAVEEVEVAPGRPPVEIVLPLVEVRGRVRRGKEPLAATLWFGGRAGARRVRFDADEEGRFEGVLPEEGTWRVELVAEEAGLKLAVPPVEVKRRKGSRVAEVEVLLSDTTLAGEVVDEAGREVPEAALTVTSQGERMSTSVRCCDERGRFEVRGLPTGRAIVEAEARGGASGPVEVFLEEGRPSPWLRIVVRRRTEIAGRVLSASGPVPGAEILAWPDLGQAGLATIEGAVTGPDGAFDLRLPPGGEALNLVVFAPGHALRLLRLGSGLDQPLEIPVEPSGGTLILEMPEEGKGQPLLAHGGTFITPFVLQRWARLQGSAQGEGQRLVLPNLESGPYLLCAGTGASQRLRQGQQPSPAECASGILAPLGELTLRLPEGRGGRLRRHSSEKSDIPP